MEGWVRVLRPFNSISVISRRWKGDHERLCAMKRCLGSGRISPPAGFEPATLWSEVESANLSATRTPPWGYCQWYWQCLHIQTKGALITCINHCHLLELTLLCLVDLWKLDESISSFKGAWRIYFISYRNTCTCMQRVKILIIRHVLRRLIWACTVCLCPFLQDTMHK